MTDPKTNLTREEVSCIRAGVTATVLELAAEIDRLRAERDALQEYARARIDCVGTAPTAEQYQRVVAATDRCAEMGLLP